LYTVVIVNWIMNCACIQQKCLIA